MSKATMSRAVQSTSKTSKQVLPASERVQKQFKSLVAQIEGGHLQNAIKTCDKILRLQPNDSDALQTKLILFLQTEQYKSALDLAKSLQNGNQGSFQILFGMAYALYRLNCETEASGVVDAITPNGNYEDRGLLHMKAQIEYRSGNYPKAVALYTQIFDSALAESDEQSDSLTNLTAAQTHLDFLQSGFQRSLRSLPHSVVDSLEDAPPPVIVPPATRDSTSVVVAAATNKTDTPPVKKVRASRVPKGVVPGVTPPPNPERWLKKSQRTNLHHTGKRRKQGANTTQGSLVESAPKITTNTSSKGKKKK